METGRPRRVRYRSVSPVESPPPRNRPVAGRNLFVDYVRTAHTLAIISDDRARLRGPRRASKLVITAGLSSRMDALGVDGRTNERRAARLLRAFTAPINPLCGADGRMHRVTVT